jgi:hypothetical protein
MQRSQLAKAADQRPPQRILAFAPQAAAHETEHLQCASADGEQLVAQPRLCKQLTEGSPGAARSYLNGRPSAHVVCACRVCKVRDLS